MGKGNNNNKEALILQAKVNSLKDEIKQHQEVLEDVKRWEADKAQMEAELEQLREKLAQHGEAEKIISEKEQILADANDQKAKLDENNNQLTAAISEKQNEYDRLVDLIGQYSSAEELLNAGKDKAKEIEEKAEKAAKEKEEEWTRLISEAEQEAAEKKKNADDDAKQIRKAADDYATEKRTDADKLLADAGTQATSTINASKDEAKQIVDTANAEKKKILEDKDTILSDAQNSAAKIIEEANETVAQYYRCKETEGESRKQQIIKSAEDEKARILDAARADAKTIADGITNAANDYSEKKRASVEDEIASSRANHEKEANNIAETAQKRAAAIIQKQDAELERARTEADRIQNEAISTAAKIKEEAVQATQAMRTSLENEKNRLAIKDEDLEGKLKEVSRKEEVLKRREENLEDEIAERVESECEKAGNRFDTLVNTANLLRSENKRLNEELKNNFVARSVVVDANELNELRRQIGEFRQKGVTEDTIDEFVSANVDLKKADKQIEKLKEENRKISQQVRESRNESDELADLKDKNKYYQEMVQALQEELEKNKTVSRDDMLAPIKLVPSFMSQKSLPDDRDIASEQEWLNIIYDKIGSKSEHSDLKFSRRQIYAYHTAQKIRDMSPLVVLAGVSGTGKSELPKNYAIHGGMNFLSIPVKPDWDSPASLFGYYNSIERRFEATDLVRSLYQMSKDDVYKKQMMMVLLDEMNLAHPEQYFADMLSKLETCRGMSDYAQYDILLGGGERPEHLDIGQNILWTGTMNEDETTKGLSDKVIDRSTLITFPRPKELFNREQRKEIKQEFVLSTAKWASWVSKVNTSDELKEKLEEYRGIVQSMNECMSSMGRNLGHRVWQSMSQYICHHPDVVYAKNKEDLDTAIKRAFGDAVAFKVMPKLRGVEVRGQNEEKLEQIGSILSLHADELVADYNNARQLTTELFQWCSADFMNKDDE